MMAKRYCGKIFLMVIFGMIHLASTAQSVKNTLSQQKTAFYELRGNNAIDFGAGTSIINGDLVDPKFEVYFHAGYKRYIFPYLNINIGYNKFNLAYTDVYNEGYMSFDLNLESTLLPHKRFSPFIFVGAGYNASNSFEDTATKFQGGGGIEYIITNGLGIKLYSDYNYVLSDELDGLIAGSSDDSYIRIALGINYYFGGEKKKTKIEENQPSVINSSQIISHN